MASATVLLSMNAEEAQALFDLLESVGGPPKSRRRHCDAILSALQSQGMESSEAGDIHTDPARPGSIYFKTQR